MNDVHKYLALSHQIGIVWSIEDVKEVRPDAERTDSVWRYVIAAKQSQRSQVNAVQKKLVSLMSSAH